MWGAYFGMGAYKRDVAGVIKMGAYIHRVLIFYGCLLSWFYSTLLLRSVWGQDSYLLQCCQAQVHSQSISQGSASRISNSIPSKTMKESTPELV